MERDELSHLTERWSPGDLSRPLLLIEPNDVSSGVANAEAARRDWATTPLPQKITHLRSTEQALIKAAEELTHAIALEVGKPLTEHHRTSRPMDKMGIALACIPLRPPQQFPPIHPPHH